MPPKNFEANAACLAFLIQLYHSKNGKTESIRERILDRIKMLKNALIEFEEHYDRN